MKLFRSEVSVSYVAEALILVNITAIQINNTGTKKVYRHEAAGAVVLLPHIQCLIEAGDASKPSTRYASDVSDNVWRVTAWSQLMCAPVSYRCVARFSFHTRH